MKLTKNQKRAIKAIYRHYPQPFDPADVVDYDCSTPSHYRRCEGHRLSLTKRPLLLDLHQIADLCFSESDEIRATAHDALNDLIDRGFVRKLLDLTRMRARLDYENKPLPSNSELDVWLYQATQAGIDHVTRRRRAVWRGVVWLFTTFATASGITLILKLLGAKL